MLRASRHAALLCLTQAALALFVLPGLHVLVHQREHQAAKRPHWVLLGAQQAQAAAPAHDAHCHAPTTAACAHAHEPAQQPGHPGDAPGAPSHHHPGDRDGHHGAGALEHLTAFFIEPAPAALPPQLQLITVAPVALQVGRMVAAERLRAHAVRGPPRRS